MNDLPTWHPRLLNTRRDLDVAITGLLYGPLHELELVTDPTPGAYGLFYVGPLAMYRRLWRPATTEPAAVSGGYPIYIGKAQRGLVRRMRDHVINLQGVRDVRPDDLRVVILPVEHPAQAGYLEELLIQTFEPVWCERRLAGFGSMPPGRNRRDHQAPSRWSVLHPGRRGTPRRAAVVSREELVEIALAHIERTVPREPV